MIFVAKILLNIEYSCPILEKYLNITFNYNPSIVVRVVPCELTDRHNVAHT